MILLRFSSLINLQAVKCKGTCVTLIIAVVTVTAHIPNLCSYCGSGIIACTVSVNMCMVTKHEIPITVTQVLLNSLKARMVAS